jgi:putative SOS response-associated peptidase YedK
MALTVQDLRDHFRDHFGIVNAPNLTARYNIAPTQDVAVVRLHADGKHYIDQLRWGLIPSWAKDKKIGYQCINARGETVAEKPAFRAAFKQRRCLMVADGYYEWQNVDGKKLPWLFTVGDDEPIAFAGLWESWKSPEGETIETAALVTTEPNEVAAQIHDRMPAILDPADYEKWLDPKAQPDSLKSLVKPYSPSRMKARRVSTKLNNARNEGRELLQAE